MRSFGMSAPITVVAAHFGFTVEHVVVAAKRTITTSTGVSA
jgi:transketolase